MSISNVKVTTSPLMKSTIKVEVIEVTESSVTVKLAPSSTEMTLSVVSGSMEELTAMKGKTFNMTKNGEFKDIPKAVKTGCAPVRVNHKADLY